MSDWNGLIKTSVGGLDAISVPNRDYITYVRNSDSYEMLLVNCTDDSGVAFLDMYAEEGASVGVTAVHPRDGLAASGYDWDDRDGDLGDNIYLLIGDDAKDGSDGPFMALELPRDVAVQVVESLTDMLAMTEKGI